MIVCLSNSKETETLERVVQKIIESFFESF